MENVINFISNIDNSTYNKIRHSKSDAECRRYLKEELSNQLNLTDVNQQREKFLDFAKNLNKYLFLEVREELLERFTDSYIKNNNYEN